MGKRHSGSDTFEPFGMTHNKTSMFPPEKSKTTNKYSNFKTLEHLWQKCFGQNLWPDNWSLKHDKVTSPTTTPVNRSLAKRLIPALKHLPHSPDLAPCDFSCPETKRSP
jgi:hypothetical protein